MVAITMSMRTGYMCQKIILLIGMSMGSECCDNLRSH